MVKIGKHRKQGILESAKTRLMHPIRADFQFVRIATRTVTVNLRMHNVISHIRLYQIRARFN